MSQSNASGMGCAARLPARRLGPPQHARRRAAGVPLGPRGGEESSDNINVYSNIIIHTTDVAYSADEPAAHAALMGGAKIKIDGNLVFPGGRRVYGRD